MFNGLTIPFDLMATGSILAYLDPGLGSYAVQLVMAGIFGGLFALKQSWADLKVWVASRPFAPRVRTPDLDASPGSRSPSHGRSPATID